MTESTPGPYTTHDYEIEGHKGYLIEGPQPDINTAGQRIAFVFCDEDNGEENARLIAAAPEMLAKLKKLIQGNHLECNCGPVCDSNCTYSEVVSLINKADRPE